MTGFQPKNPDYRAIAIHTFEQQRAMKTLGISIVRLEPGEVDLAMDYSAEFTQQHGFIHAGIITADRDHERHVDGAGVPRWDKGQHVHAALTLLQNASFCRRHGRA
jgi:hypothetical protein